MLSGYKINWHKSEGMPIMHTCHCNDVTTFNFKWVPSGMQHMGIQIKSKFGWNNGYENGVTSSEDKSNLDKWGNLKLPLWDKINVIKMVVAPQFNYVSMMLPVDTSPQLFKQLDRIIRDFYWDRKRPRINIKKMCSPRDTGGLGLPNVRLYNLAFEMSQLSMHWKGTDPDLSLIKIEQELAGPFKPLDVLSHSLKTDGHDDSSNPVLANSEEVWKEVHRMCGVSHFRQSCASLWLWEARTEWMIFSRGKTQDVQTRNGIYLHKVPPWYTCTGKNIYINLTHINLN